MSRVVASLAVSLDGRIARSDGAVDWLDPFPPDAAFEAFLAGVDAIVMGRGTYDAVRRLEAWPYAARPTVVLTSRPLDADPPPGVTAHAGPAAAAFDGLTARHRLVWLAGGGVVLAAGLRDGRVDALDLVLIPLTLGEGAPLFPDGAPAVALALREATPLAGGMVRLRYDVAGPGATAR